MPGVRSYERSAADLRPVEVEAGFVRTADGSALYSQGETRVICTASVQALGPALDAGLGARLGYGGVRDAPGVDGRAQGA